MGNLTLTYYKTLLKSLRESYWEKVEKSFVKINYRNYKNYLRVVRKEKWLFFFNFSKTLTPIDSCWLIVDFSNHNQQPGNYTLIQNRNIRNSNPSDDNIEFVERWINEINKKIKN